jgi:hypothetical protein
MDWTGCHMVEIDHEKVGGTPVVKGTRIPAEVVLVDEEYGRTPETNSRKFSYPSSGHNPAPPGVRALYKTAVAALKVLLDENVPHDLLPYLKHHATFTAVYMGWAGLANGHLLDAAEKAGFDARPVIEPHVESIVAALNLARPGSFTRVEVGKFARAKQKPKGFDLG